MLQNYSKLLKNDQKLFAMAQNSKTTHFRAIRIKLRQVRVPKISQFGEKNILEIGPRSVPPFNIGFGILLW